MVDPKRHQQTSHSSLLGLSTWFTCVGIVFLLLWGGALQCYRRKRERRRGDGFLALDDWEPHIRGITSFTGIVGIIVPVMFFAQSFMFGGLLAAFEGWTYEDGFEYVLGNAVGIGPLIDMQPSAHLGKAGNIVVSLLSLIACSTVLGLTATSATALQLITGVDGLNKRVLCLVLFLIVPAMLVILAVASGLIVALLEDWTVLYGFLFMIGNLCGVQTPFTQDTPQTVEGNFVTCLCFTLELAVSGVIIGIIGDHPALHNLMDFLEGAHSDSANQLTTDSLDDLLKNESWEVRMATAELMGKLGNVMYAEPLKAILNDDVHKVRDAATAALALLAANTFTDPDKIWDVSADKEVPIDLRLSVSI